MDGVNIYYTLGLLLFMVVAAVLLVRYVNLTVDEEFRSLARAASDHDFRDTEMGRINGLLEEALPIPEDAPALSGPPSAIASMAPPVMLGAGVILVWGGVFAYDERRLWLYGGAALALVAVLVMLATLRRRRWRRTARLLRFRADLRRMDGNHAGAAADLENLLRLTPWDDAAWAELSDDMSSEGRLEEALDAVRQAGRLDPRYDEYKMLETSLNLRLGRLSAARDALSDWAAVEGAIPDDPRRAIYQAAIDLAEGRADQAAETARRALTEDGRLPDVFLDSDAALEGVRGLLPGGDRK